MRFTKEDRIYVPSSALLEDIKKLTNKPSQVLAIIDKDSMSKQYNKIRHVAKGLKFEAGSPLALDNG